MRLVIPCWVVWLLASAAPAQTNLVENARFEQDADANHIPDAWQAAGDSRLVEQTLDSDTGRDGKPCARLRCTKFQSGNPAAHAMLCQFGVPVQQGRAYRLVLWARAENLAADMVSIALSDTSVWANCGLEDGFVPTPEWRRYEFLFRATRTCSQKSRFQIWFTSTGTLWIDDVELTEAGKDLYHPGRIIQPAGGKNLVPNASFECGTAGWGSEAWDRTIHWGGGMNRLFGRLDTAGAFQGSGCLRIELSPENRPVSFFDYYQLSRSPVQAPLAGNVGFVEVEPGRKHTLSAFLKAAAADTPARLAVRQFDGRTFDRAVRLSADWQRYSLVFTPTSRWCYVLAGPDLRKTAETPDPPERATVWLDAVQLELGDEPTPFEPRSAVELGLETDSPGNVFDWSQPLVFRVILARADADKPDKATLDLRLTDFFDEQVWRQTLSVDVPPDGSKEQAIEIPPQPQLRGFMRLHAKMTAGECTVHRQMRLAAIPVFNGEDSRFGVNHAYPWPHLLDLCRKAGLLWVRDWSCKWQEVEPEKGRFTFAETDYQIDRPLEHGLRVLGLLPFPSSHWSSSAPASVPKTGRYPQSRERVAFAPRDEAEFETYVARTVGHYKGRVRWWQVFNEPLFTSYSLPRKHGYTGADYARWTKAFARAARRADPDCRVLAGIGYLGEGQVMEDFEQLFAAGGLAAIDAVDIHHYPRIRPPEFAEALLEQLNACMQRHGGRKPIWLTEYGYYADDDPWKVPMPHEGFDRPLADERLQAEYAVRWAAIMFAGGVEKIFYHAGTCDSLNRDSLQGIFFEYAGRPHKIYAAQAVLARLLPPQRKFLKKLDLGPGVWCYVFGDGEALLAVLWAPHKAGAEPIPLGDDRVGSLDIMGRPQKRRQVTPGPTPCYLTAEGLSVAELEAALASGPTGR